MKINKSTKIRRSLGFLFLFVVDSSRRKASRGRYVRYNEEDMLIRKEVMRCL